MLHSVAIAKAAKVNVSVNLRLSTPNSSSALCHTDAKTHQKLQMPIKGLSVSPPLLHQQASIMTHPAPVHKMGNDSNDLIIPSFLYQLELDIIEHLTKSSDCSNCFPVMFSALKINLMHPHQMQSDPSAKCLLTNRHFRLPGSFGTVGLGLHICAMGT